MPIVAFLCAVLPIDDSSILWYNRSMGEYPEYGSRPGHSERGDILAPVSKAQQKAVAKYNAKTYDRIEVKVPKGKKEVIQDCALAAGESLNEYVATAIDERMERDTAASAQEGNA